MNVRTTKITAIGVLILCAVSACGTTPPARLYILEPMTASTSLSDDPGLTIIIGPVTLPDYIDQKGIVTHDQRFRVHTSDFDRWVEPLGQNVTRVLGENLAMLFSGSRIVAYPQDSAQGADFSIHVHITEFGSSPGGNVVLKASWSIHGEANVATELGNTRYSLPRRGDDMLALVEGMSQAVEQLSRDIANAIIAEPAR